MLSLLAIITYLDRVCIAVAGPRMQDELHISPELWGWVTSVFFLSYSAFEIPTGALGDRIGPRRVLTRIVLWWSAFTSLTGAVSNYSVLLLVRFCFGIGEAGALPNAGNVIARWVPPLKRARGCGIFFMSTQIGGAISPLLVVPIQARYGWRASFWVFGVVGVLWSALWYWWFRDSPSEKAGVSAAELQEIGASPAPKHQAIPWSVALRSGTLWQLMGIGACYLYAMSFFQSWLQTYLVKGRGYTEAALVLSSVPYIVGTFANFLGGMASDWLARRWGLKTGRRALGAFGLSFAAVFMAAALITRNNTWALIFLSLSYSGILLQQPNLGAAILDTARKRAGVTFGFVNSAANAASTVSTVAFGYIVGYTGSYEAPLIPMVVTLAVGALLWLKVDPTREIFAEEPVAPGIIIPAL